MKLLAGLLVWLLMLPCTALGIEPLKVGLGNFRPYFSADGDSGVFVDLLRTIFREIPEYTVEYVPNLSNLRLLSGLHSGHLDAAVNIFDGQLVDGCISDRVFRFQDVVVSYKRQGLKIDSVDDLAGLDIVSYQGARAFLGEAYRKVVGQSAFSYQEQPNQHLQAKMLIAQRVDVSVGDRYIFAQEALTLGKRRSAFTYHPIFPLTYTHMAFRDTNICPKFNRVLARLISSGEYQRVYRESLGQIEIKFRSEDSQ